jgi:hypothetical protein
MYCPIRTEIISNHDLNNHYSHLSYRQRFVLPTSQSKILPPIGGRPYWPFGDIGLPDGINKSCIAFITALINYRFLDLRLQNIP